MRKLLVILTAFCLAVLLIGVNVTESDVHAPTPGPTATPTTVLKETIKAAAVQTSKPRATAKPVIIYTKTTPRPKATASGSSLSTPEPISCIENFVNEKWNNRARLEAAYKAKGCDTAFFLYISDPRNCSKSVNECYEVFMDLPDPNYAATVGYYEQYTFEFEK